MLGFRTAQNIMTIRNTIAPSVYQLNIDNYINIFISNLSSTNNITNAHGSACHFKVILNAINNTMYYASENNTYSQFIEVNNSLPINNLNIIIYDRWGYNLNSSGLDYSITFCVES